jgi:hypothetical protein
VSAEGIGEDAYLMVCNAAIHKFLFKYGLRTIVDDLFWYS